jgi:hypothetical protein
VGALSVLRFAQAAPRQVAGRVLSHLPYVRHDERVPIREAAQLQSYRVLQRLQVPVQRCGVLRASFCVPPYALQGSFPLLPQQMGFPGFAVRSSGNILSGSKKSDSTTTCPRGRLSDTIIGIFT